ncbi:MAG: transketolase family protein, partial [Butyrivibrio sp.]|nr:transketolase family protein [Butyrivibrio sp.]
MNGTNTKIREDIKDMRDAYCDALIAAAQKDEKVIVINCDLASSMGTGRFAEIFPERYFNMGIQEANACGMAAGLSLAGYIPFFNSFAVFSSRRICDQIFLSCAYAGLNVKIAGGDAGVCAAMNGGTHMAFEDFGVLRSIPGIRLLEPADTVMMESIMPQILSSYSVDYFRMPRKKVMKIYEKGAKFTIGKANVLREGQDVTIIAEGIMVAEALNAAAMLSLKGIQARVVDMFTIKPIDV